MSPASVMKVVAIISVLYSVSCKLGGPQLGFHLAMRPLEA